MEFLRAVRGCNLIDHLGNVDISKDQKSQSVLDRVRKGIQARLKVLFGINDRYMYS